MLKVVTIDKGMIEIQGDTARDLVPLLRQEQGGLFEFIHWEQSHEEGSLSDDEVTIDADDILLMEGGKKFSVQLPLAIPDEEDDN